MERGLKPNSLTVYNAVLASMPAGATAADVVEALQDQLTRTVIWSSLKNLVRSGYLTASEPGTRCRYKTTDKVPATQHAAEQASAGGDDEGDDTEHLFNKRQAPQGKPPGVAASVFELGAMCGAAGSAAQPPVEPARASAPAPAARPAQGLAWKAPAAAIRVPVLKEAAAPASSAAVPPAPAAPRFAIGSDDCLDIHDDELQVRLKPATTRALFQWLDRVGRAYASLLEELPL